MAPLVVLAAAVPAAAGRGAVASKGTWGGRCCFASRPARRVAGAAVSGGGGDSAGGEKKYKVVDAEKLYPGATEEEKPWNLGWQLNERYLSWSESAASQLVRMTVARELGVTVEECDAKLSELTLLLPDLTVGKLESIKPKILVSLLTDLKGVALRLVRLRDIFPRANVSLLAVRRPGLLLGEDLDVIAERAADLRANLPGMDVDEAVTIEPLWLNVTDPAKVLSEVERLMPGKDPNAILRSCEDPSTFLDMKVLDMPTSETLEDGTIIT